jgi:hypothetical protein
VKVRNVSGGPVSFPLVGRDVDADEVVEVPDGTNLPADYFQPVTETKPAAKPAASTKE